MMTRRSAAWLMMAAAGCQRNTRKRIAVIPKATSHIFWLAVKAGAVSAGEKFGVEIEWNGPAAETDFARQIQIVDSAIARRLRRHRARRQRPQGARAGCGSGYESEHPTTIFDSGLDSGKLHELRRHRQR
jgi:ribose transport system substrate-binding protein